MSGLCLDCITRSDGKRCPSCGSPRLVSHPELFDLAISHIDCDAFYAAIEKRDDPSLRDQPVIIGGGRRGVVSTACYIARINGVRSAMPMFKALKACPDAVVIKPNMEKYSAVGREIRTLMKELTPLVEPLSIDEAFLDLTGTERVHRMPPAETLARFAARIENEIGVTVSVGLSGNKFLAKIASDLEKPRGFSVIAPEEAPAFLAPKPVGFIWGIGPAMQKRLNRDGLRTIADLQRRGERWLAGKYGATGSRLAHLAFGEDVRNVNPSRPNKSVSAETTFNEDLSEADDLVPILWRLSEKVSRRLKKAGIAGRTVTLKLKTADFRTRTRSQSLPEPTLLAGTMFEIGRGLLEPELDGTRFRLIGVGVSELGEASEADPESLLDPMPGKRAAAERAVDAVRAKFGKTSVERGIGMGSSKRRQQ